MEKIYDFNLFSNINENKVSDTNELSEVIWVKNDDEWGLDEKVRSKLLKAAKEFYSEFSELVNENPIIDIQISGPFTHKNTSKDSEIDIHIILEDLEKLFLDNQFLEVSIRSKKFKWNVNNHYSVKGIPVDFFLTRKDRQHDNSPLYSLVKNKWIVTPDFDLKIDDRDISRKFDDISFEIDEINGKLSSKTYFPSNYDAIYKRGIKLKNKIYGLRRDFMKDKNGNSINFQVFKKLKKSGYIDKLIDILSKSYSKIQSNKK